MQGQVPQPGLHMYSKDRGRPLRVLSSRDECLTENYSECGGMDWSRARVDGEAIRTPSQWSAGRNEVMRDTEDVGDRIKQGEGRGVE